MRGRSANLIDDPVRTLIWRARVQNGTPSVSATKRGCLPLGNCVKPQWGVSVETGFKGIPGLQVERTTCVLIPFREWSSLSLPECTRLLRCWRRLSSAREAWYTSRRGLPSSRSPRWLRYSFHIVSPFTFLERCNYSGPTLSSHGSNSFQLSRMLRTNNLGNMGIATRCRFEDGERSSSQVECQDVSELAGRWRSRRIWTLTVTTLFFSRFDRENLARINWTAQDIFTFLGIQIKAVVSGANDWCSMFGSGEKGTLDTGWQQ